MKSNRASTRQILTFLVFTGAVGMLFALNLILEPPEVLLSERRVPAAFPELSVKSVLSAGFMEKFEGYAADRFPFREEFRALRAVTVLDVFLQSDKSGVYRDEAVGVGEFKRADEAALRQTAKKILAMAQKLDGMNIYYSVIPDKSVYAAKYLPGYDHAAAEAVLKEELGALENIPLKEKLAAASFYKTDLHWDQTKIVGAARHILVGMDAKAVPGEYHVVTAGEFFGVYAGRLGLPVASDTLAFADIAGLAVSYLNEHTLELEPGELYAPERISDVDPYDVFLRGPQPLIIIENASAATARELYLFRDSFGSSLAPLLAGAYSKITVIDLRYLNAELLTQFVELKAGSDALFIYSSQILNNPSVLQV